VTSYRNHEQSDCGTAYTRENTSGNSGRQPGRAGVSVKCCNVPSNSLR
jgi:hypothetical protein